MSNRIIVLGGRGFFGAAVLTLLRKDGLHPLVASRRPGADLQVDPDDGASIRRSLRRGDLIVDAAGPFQQRSTSLVGSAIEIGFDVIDLSDSLDYSAEISRLQPRIDDSGIRVLTACSSVSAVSAALVRLLAESDPIRVSAILAPATRNTSTAATAASLFSSLKGPIRVFSGGSLIDARAFSQGRVFNFAPPVGRVHAWLSESADAVMLPRIWPTLKDVDFWIDARRAPLNALLRAASRYGGVRFFARTLHPLGRKIARRFGAKAGGYAVQVQEGNGRCALGGFVHATDSYVVAVAPAVLAVRAIATGRFPKTGLIRADDYADPEALVRYLTGMGVKYFLTSTGPGGSRAIRDV